MADQKAVSYVRSRMDAGWPASKIRTDLYNEGWSKKDAEEAISSAKAMVGSPATPKAEDVPAYQAPAHANNLLKPPQDKAPENNSGFPGEGRAESKMVLYAGMIIIIAA